MPLLTRPVLESQLIDRLSWFEKADQLEVSVCRALNRTSDQPIISVFFQAISRLGDGVFWYSLILLLPLLYGAAGIAISLQLTLTGLICVIAYKLLKGKLTRPRPYITFPDLTAVTPPLDLYSFPSGHTMNAVNFTVLTLWYLPELSVFLIPFTLLIGLSRIILGVHYPTDVIAGALLGILISTTSLMVVSSNWLA